MKKISACLLLSFVLPALTQAPTLSTLSRGRIEDAGVFIVSDDGDPMPAIIALRKGELFVSRIPTMSFSGGRRWLEVLTQKEIGAKILEFRHGFFAGIHNIAARDAEGRLHLLRLSADFRRVELLSVDSDGASQEPGLFLVEGEPGMLLGLPAEDGGYKIFRWGKEAGLVAEGTIVRDHASHGVVVAARDGLLFVFSDEKSGTLKVERLDSELASLGGAREVEVGRSITPRAVFPLTDGAFLLIGEGDGRVFHLNISRELVVRRVESHEGAAPQASLDDSILSTSWSADGGCFRRYSLRDGPRWPDITGTWQAEMKASPVTNDRGFTSSTRLAVSWLPPQHEHHHLHLGYAESVGGTTGQLRLDAGSQAALLTGLRAGTEYALSLWACLNEDCQQALWAQMPVSASTAEEVWQLRGKGRGFAGIDRVVSGGNNIAYVFRYGPEAGPELEDHLRLYFHPWPRSGPGKLAVIPGLSKGGVFGGLDAISSFQAEWECGLANPHRTTPKVKRLATFQAVPLKSGHIRLFFEALGADKATRLFSLDSADGFAGLDFHPGSATQVVDYSSDGQTAPTLVLGVHGDEPGGDTGLLQSRQSKVGWPVLDSWFWDEAPGSFMIVTGMDAARQTGDGLFFATLTENGWQVEKDGDGRARPLALHGHGPVLVHIGGGKYKLYYEDSRDGMIDKPTLLLYADAAKTGDPQRIEFDDWESAGRREVHFLWPDGTPLSAANESGLGDHCVICPTGDIDFQVMYVNLGGMDDSSKRQASQGIGMAVLRNP